jgi:hypothetical protein
MIQWPNGDKINNLTVNQQIMTEKELMDLIRHPENVSENHLQDLKELVELYPYFSAARVLYLKSLQLSGSIHTEIQINQTVLYVADRKWLYFYLYPDRKLHPEAPLPRHAKFTGSYFDLLDAAEAEGGDTGHSLKKIAEKLKASRILHESQEKPREVKPPAVDVELQKPVSIVEVFEEIIEDNPSVLEEKSKSLIREKQYKEAIQVLHKLNLINPKKSVYFADQIRFLEKIIANS